VTRAEVLSYGGGRQTVAICVLIAQGKLPRPERIVMADTGREATSTWEYLDAHVRPLLRAAVGLEVEVAGHELATVDLYHGEDRLLIPAFTRDGGDGGDDGDNLPLFGRTAECDSGHCFI